MVWCHFFISRNLMVKKLIISGKEEHASDLGSKEIGKNHMGIPSFYAVLPES